MTTAARIATQLVKIDDAIKVVSIRTQEKIDALLASCPLHSHFVIEGQQHPYYLWHAEAVSLQQLLQDFAESVSTISIKGRTVRDELQSKVSGLLVTGSSALDMDDVASKASNLYRVAAHVWSHAEPKITRSKIRNEYGRVNGNIELPFVNIRKECGDVVREVKKVVKELLDEQLGTATLREALSKKLVEQALFNSPQDTAMRFLYELKT